MYYHTLYSFQHLQNSICWLLLFMELHYWINLWSKSS